MRDKTFTYSHVTASAAATYSVMNGTFLNNVADNASSLQIDAVCMCAIAHSPFDPSNNIWKAIGSMNIPITYLSPFSPCFPWLGPEYLLERFILNAVSLRSSL
jgi:hypothetical protein